MPKNKILKIHSCSHFGIDPNSEQNDAYFLQCAASKFKYLQKNDKLLVLMLDEIHLNPYLDTLSHLHPAARQFCRSTYTITDITIK
jgi:hypothetical protein